MPKWGRHRKIRQELLSKSSKHLYHTYGKPASTRANLGRRTGPRCGHRKPLTGSGRFKDRSTCVRLLSSILKHKPQTCSCTGGAFLDVLCVRTSHHQLLALPHLGNQLLDDLVELRV